MGVPVVSLGVLVIPVIMRDGLLTPWNKHTSEMPLAARKENVFEAISSGFLPHGFGRGGLLSASKHVQKAEITMKFVPCILW